MNSTRAAEGHILRLSSIYPVLKLTLVNKLRLISTAILTVAWASSIMKTVRFGITDPASELYQIDEDPISVAKQLSDLPPELLDRIVSWLDREQDSSPPSPPHQRLERISTYASPCPLKSLSLTCHSMYNLIVPRLFRLIRLQIDDSNDIEGRGVHAEVIKPFAAFIMKYKLQKKVQSVTVRFEREKPTLGRGCCGQPLLFSSVICSQIMSVFHPETPIVLAPLSIIPYLTWDRWWAAAEDKWEFVGPLHLLHSVHRAKEQAAHMLRHIQDIPDSWSNQAVSSPSMTSNIGRCGWPPMGERGNWFDVAIEGFASQVHQDWAPNLRNITYVAIFPTLDHIRLFYKKLGQLKNLETLTVQFAPSETLDELENLARTRECPISDVWRDVSACLEMTLSFVRNIDLTYSHRKLSTLTFLDWYRYGIAMMLAHACKDYLPNFEFDNGTWRKLREG